MAQPASGSTLPASSATAGNTASSAAPPATSATTRRSAARSPATTRSPGTATPSPATASRLPMTADALEPRQQPSADEAPLGSYSSITATSAPDSRAISPAAAAKIRFRAVALATSVATRRAR
jgi:hypothetical protein